MKLIKTKEAEGHILCHDVTQIIKGVKKDAVFRKGHVVKKQDIPILLSIGKDYLYIWENDESMLHENDAAAILRDICMGENIEASEPKEGKIELFAKTSGLMTIDKTRLDLINSLGQIIIATRHGGFSVRKRDKLAGTRIIPLLIQKEKMQEVKLAAGEKPLINVLPFKSKKVGVITTGNEVFYGRIKDDFTPVIKSKFQEFGSTIKQHIILNDDHKKITNAINEMIESEMDIIVCTGGMSIDPDDKTPLAIKNSNVNVIRYGVPVLPGAMFMLAYTKDNRPVVGLPGCVMYEHRTILDLVLPSLLADSTISELQLSSYGRGGLCLNCKPCSFPNCGFGK